MNRSVTWLSSQFPVLSATRWAASNGPAASTCHSAAVYSTTPAAAGGRSGVGAVTVSQPDRDKQAPLLHAAYGLLGAVVQREIGCRLVDLDDITYEASRIHERLLLVVVIGNYLSECVTEPPGTAGLAHLLLAGRCRRSMVVTTRGNTRVSTTPASRKLSHDSCTTQA